MPRIPYTDFEPMRQELIAARERITELEAKNARLQKWSAAWKRKAKILRDDVHKCHGMANEINILVDANRKSQEALLDVEWILDARRNLYFCPWCGKTADTSVWHIHNPGCLRQEALKE